MNRFALAVAVHIGTALLVTALAGCGAVHHPLEVDGSAAGSGGTGPIGGGLGGMGGSVQPPGTGGTQGGDPVDAGRRGDGDGGRRGDRGRDGGAVEPVRDGGQRDSGDRQRPDGSALAACPADAMQGGVCMPNMGTLCTITGDGGLQGLCTCRAGRNGGAGTWRCFRR